MKSEVSTTPQKSDNFDRHRVKVDERWSEKKLDDTLDLTGKRLHIFQLPPQMPVECLNGLELPAPRKKKWSKPVTVSYTSNEGKVNEEKHTVALKAQQLSNSTETLLQVVDGQLATCGVPVSLYQGFEVVEDADINIPDIPPQVHKLPEGLRQRFTPIGSSLVKEKTTSSTQPTAAKKTKRKSVGHAKAAESEMPPKKSRKKANSGAVTDNESIVSVSPRKRKRHS